MVTISTGEKFPILHIIFLFAQMPVLFLGIHLNSHLDEYAQNGITVETTIGIIILGIILKITAWTLFFLRIIKKDEDDERNVAT